MGKYYFTRTFWKELGPDFAVVQKPDLDQLSFLIRKAKGNRTVQQFARECDVSICAINQTLYHKRVRPMFYQHIVSIAEHAAPGSGVTLDLLMSANGMTHKKPFKKCIHKISVDQRKVAHMMKSYDFHINAAANAKKPALKKRASEITCTLPNEVSQEEFDSAMLWDNFIKNIGYFAIGRAPDQVKLLHEKKTEFFKDSTICLLLALYRSYDEQEKENRIRILKTFYKGEGELIYPESQASHYKTVLEQLLFEHPYVL